MVQLDCGLVLTEGLASPTVDGAGGLGRLTELKDLGWLEGFSFGGWKGLRWQEGRV
jgi:hypothetical protein